MEISVRSVKSVQVSLCGQAILAPSAENRGQRYLKRKAGKSVELVY